VWVHPVFIPIVITRRLECWSQTITPPANNYLFNALVNNLQKQTSTTLVTDFVNSNDVDCPAFISLVDGSGNALSTELSVYLYINGAGQIEFDNSYYLGQSITARVKVLTSFNDAVYKDIDIVESVGYNCLYQTLQQTILVPFEFAAIKHYPNDDPVVTTIVVADGFTNSDVVKCPVEYSLVDEAKNPLAGDDANAFSIVGAAINVNQEHYNGGTMNLYVKARTGYNEPVFKSFTVTQLPCETQTLTLTGGIRPLIVATPSVVDSLIPTTETLASLYTNSQPKRCFDITYTILD